MDGALTTQPSTEEVLPARNTSASSMQSPPARADATRVSILSPACWPAPGRIAQVNVAVRKLAQTQSPGERERQDQPGIGYQAGIVEGDLDAVRVVTW